VSNEVNTQRLHAILNEGDRATFELCTVAHGTQYMIRGEPLFLLDICRQKSNRKNSSKWVGTDYATICDIAELAGFKVPHIIEVYRYVSPLHTVEYVIESAKKHLKRSRSYVDGISLPEGFVARLEYRDTSTDEFRVLRCKYVFPYFEPGKFMVPGEDVRLNTWVYP
jgi:hypothetical protein